MDGWGDGGGCWLGVISNCVRDTQRGYSYLRSLSFSEDLVSEEEFQAPT